MFGFIVRRIVSSLLVLLVTSAVVFAVFFYGPNDPAESMCPENRCTTQRLESIRTNLGLDRPVTTQYAEYLKGIVAGRQIDSGVLKQDCHAPCLGISFKLKVNVFDYLWERFPATFSIAIGASLIFLTLGVSIGIFAARRRGQMADKLAVGASLGINAIPFYVVALLGYLYLISAWGVFPDSGYNSFTSSPWAWAKGLIVPWLVLGLTNATAYARFSRASMIETMGEDYVRTARAKGLSDRNVVIKHALRAAIVPVVTIFGLDFASLLGGTIILERIYNVDGIGRQALLAVQTKDLPIISATVLISAAFIVVANTVVDILYSVIDPRVRLT